MANTKKSINYKKGKTAEDKIALIYKDNGFSILKKRYKNQHGEIDIIAQKESEIAFIEVKHRKQYHNIEEALLDQQKTRISKAASLFLQENSPQYDSFNTHFDVAFCIPSFEPIIIENAWTIDELYQTSDN